jgi:hypothetical protein
MTWEAAGFGRTVRLTVTLLKMIGEPNYSLQVIPPELFADLK